MNISGGGFPKRGILCQNRKSKPRVTRRLPARISNLPTSLNIAIEPVNPRLIVVAWVATVKRGYPIEKQPFG
jgi:hypothetical protein